VSEPLDEWQSWLLQRFVSCAKHIAKCSGHVSYTLLPQLVDSVKLAVVGSASASIMDLSNNMPEILALPTSFRIECLLSSMRYFRLWWNGFLLRYQKLVDSVS